MARVNSEQGLRELDQNTVPECTTLSGKTHQCLDVLVRPGPHDEIRHALQLGEAHSVDLLTRVAVAVEDAVGVVGGESIAAGTHARKKARILHRRRRAALWRAQRQC